MKKACEQRFEAQLDFRLTLIPYEGDSLWVDDITVKLFECLNSDELPEPEPDCDYCKYLAAIGQLNG
jgi:hypothetical protein|tara:strand:+ start:488 stop:688 length:201 start_codon:yes stop_codon:yes gene_type:complete